MIDVDKYTPQQRIAQLEAALQDKRRSHADRIAILTPAWCLENWFLFLDNGEIVENKTRKYTYTRKGGSFRSGYTPNDFAAKMIDWCQSDQRRTPSSLKTSCTEWQRLKVN